MTGNVSRNTVRFRLGCLATQNPEVPGSLPRETYSFGVGPEEHTAQVPKRRGERFSLTCRACGRTVELEVNSARRRIRLILLLIGKILLPASICLLIGLTITFLGSRPDWGVLILPGVILVILSIPVLFFSFLYGHEYSVWPRTASSLCEQHAVVPPLPIQDSEDKEPTLEVPIGCCVKVLMGNDTMTKTYRLSSYYVSQPHKGTKTQVLKCQTCGCEITINMYSSRTWLKRKLVGGVILALFLAAVCTGILDPYIHWLPGYVKVAALITMLAPAMLLLESRSATRAILKNSYAGERLGHKMYNCRPLGR